MSKTELVELIAEEAGLSKAAAAKALDATLKGIEKGLKSSSKVSFVGFGTFKVTKRAARDGVNPLTGKSMHIAAKNVVSFKAGSKLKDAVN